jgi:hypothetical protein
MVQAAEKHRLLAQEMTVFAKDEGLRFVNLRLERNGAAMDKLQSCQGIPGLIGVQQEWLRDLLQDYASQSMRMMTALRGFTKNMMETTAETASENVEQMQHQASDAMHQAGEAMQQSGEQVSHMVQDTNTYGQETQH